MISLTRFSVLSFRFFFVLITTVFVIGCRYESIEETSGTASGSANSALNSIDESDNASGIQDNQTLPDIPYCDGPCTCDEAFKPFNDTGVTGSAYDYTSNASICDFSSNQIQDCQVGRDSDNAVSKSGSGAAAFDFSKVNAVGELIHINESDWACVLDNHTGLMWEVKRANGGNDPQDATRTFSWYSDDHLAYSTPGNAFCNASLQCDSQAYVDYINEKFLCGYNNWRLPNKLELQDLVNYGHAQPAIDDSFFPNTQNEFYWTSSIDTDDLKSIWAVDFNYGRVAGSSSDGSRHIRLVRDHSRAPSNEPVLMENESDINYRNIVAPIQRCNSDAESSAPNIRFKRDPDGSLFDTYTGLIWKRCIAGTSGELCEEGEGISMAWFDALNYASAENDVSLNATPWRLPSIKELQGLIETQCEEPALNPFAFPNVPMNHIWSNTPHPKESNKSYYIQYQNSIIFYGDRTEENFVHLVRSCN